MEAERQMVYFPDIGPSMEDSGEGGMFVILVVPTPEDWQNHCAVDVNVILTQPDVCLNAEHRNLWTYDLAYPNNTSLPVLAAVQMGSTHFSLCDRSKGKYWTAEYRHLTPEGASVSQSLARAYGVDPVLLTFLDT